MLISTRGASDQFLPECEQQGSTEKEKGDQAQEDSLRSVKQQMRPEKSAGDTGQEQREQNPRASRQPPSVRSRTGHGSRPQSDGRGGVRWNGRHAGKDQGGKREECSAPRNRVLNAGGKRSKEQKNSIGNRHKLFGSHIDSCVADKSTIIAQIAASAPA